MKGDIFYLARIYLGILNDEQAKSLTTLILQVRNNFIPGTMTLSECYFYHFEGILGPDSYQILSEKDNNLATANFIIVASKILLRRNKNGFDYGTTV